MSVLFSVSLLKWCWDTDKGHAGLSGRTLLSRDYHVFVDE